MFLSGHPAGVHEAQIQSGGCLGGVHVHTYGTPLRTAAGGRARVASREPRRFGASRRWNATLRTGVAEDDGPVGTAGWWLSLR